MNTATVIARNVTTKVALTITGHTIDAGETDEVPVTALRLTYHNGQVIGIDYDTIEDGVASGATVHPDFLNRPDAWPDWVRDLVDEHRPTA